MGLAAMSVGAFAQKTVPYVSLIGVPTSAIVTSTGTIDADWTTIDMDAGKVNEVNTSRVWGYSFISSFTGSGRPFDGAAYGAQIATKLSYTNDDWLVSPAIRLEAGKKYKVSWYARLSNATGVTDYKAAYIADFTKDDLTPAAGEDEVTDELFLTTMGNRLNAADALAQETHNRSNAWSQVTKQIEVATTGDYRIGFHSSESLASGSNAPTLVITGFSISLDALTPAEVTDLAATNSGEDLNVNLSWTLPTTDDTGNTLADDAITAVNVYREGTLIASLGGTATTYTDESLTAGGFYTYSVAAVIGDVEGKLVDVKTSYVGPIPAMTIPYTADFSDADMTGVYWTAIDANADGKTWKYYNSYGSVYFTYDNYSTTVTEDDWLISPKIAFGKGWYELTLKGQCSNGHLALFLGTDKTADAMTTQFGETDLTGYSTVTKTFTFQVAEAGEYYVGIHNDVSPSNGVPYQVSAFSIDATAVSIVTPDRVTDLAAQYNTEDATVVDLSWTLPTTDTEGNSLADDAITAVNVYRDGTLLATLEGTATTYSDRALTEDGTYTYGVAAVADEEGEQATVEFVYEIVVEPETVTKTVTDAGYATYCIDKPLDFTSVEGLTAYVAKISDGKVTFTAVEKAPANTGLLLQGEAADYEIAVAESADDVDNDFIGLLEDTVIPVGSFVLLDDEHGLGFYKTTVDFTAGANTAYLPALASDAKFINMAGEPYVEPLPTAISAIGTQHDAQVVCNLSGQRMAAGSLPKGVYLVNGRKVMVK